MKMILIALVFLSGCGGEVSKKDVKRLAIDVASEKVWKRECVRAPIGNSMCKIQIGEKPPFEYLCMHYFYKGGIVIPCKTYSRYKSDVDRLSDLSAALKAAKED